MNLIYEILNSSAKSYFLLISIPLFFLGLSYFNIIKMSDKYKKKYIILILHLYILFLLIHFKFINPY